MRIRPPTSRGFYRIRYSFFDTVYAVFSPAAALWARDAALFSQEAALYCLISLSFSLIAFSVFRVHEGVSRYFSVNDAVDVVKAVVSAELATGVILFIFTRFDNIPRTIPFIHALILCAGLVAVRGLARLRENDPDVSVLQTSPATEQVIMIGSTRLTFVFIKFLEAYCPGHRRVIALLDGGPGMNGRTIAGIRIVGPPDHLQPVVDEFAEHGIRTDRVIVGGDEDLLSEDALKEVQRVCKQRQITLDFVPKLIGLSTLEVQEPELRHTASQPAPSFVLPSYFTTKRVIDFILAAGVLVLALPVLGIAAALAVLDVGSPILFWQQRLGAGGRAFMIYKIRTLRPPFDQLARPVPEEQRLSWVGRFLRKTRLDELPQLLNVLVGDMSLIGPRPLLPRDQPVNPTVRLMVRPGITGWAQVNGGTLLTPSEKDVLDEWYIQNASIWLDLRILWMTFQFMFRGQRRLEQAIADARALRNDKLDLQEDKLDFLDDKLEERPRARYKIYNHQGTS